MARLLDRFGDHDRHRLPEESHLVVLQHVQTFADGGIDAPFGADSDVPADLCIQAGGQVLQQTQWMVHVWSVPGWESQQGLFGEVNPALSQLAGWDYDAAAPLERPLGGSQSAMCYLAMALVRRGHAVAMLTGTKTPVIVNGVKCLSCASIPQPAANGAEPSS